jgi:integrase
MARPPLPLGTWGEIWRWQVTEKSWAAATNFRDFDGRTRRVQRRGSTGAKAEKALREYLTTRSRAGRLGEITPDTRVRDAAQVWLTSLREEGRAPAILKAYADAIRLYIEPGIGLLQLREVTVGVCDRFLVAVKTNTGPAAAKHARTVLSGVMGLAARHEAIKANPVRDASRIKTERKEPRALTLAEVRQLRAAIRQDPKAVYRDLPELVDFMLGTGLRIGEAAAVVWDAVDLDAGTVEIRGTVIRDGELKIQPKPKTRKGWRKIHVPVWLVEILRHRRVAADPDGVVFPSQLGHLRDRSNTNADIREALDPLGFGWVTTHTFRKTTATLLDESGLTVREIADQLGHARVSVTQDTYFGRHQASPRAAAALEAIDGNQVSNR